MTNVYLVRHAESDKSGTSVSNKCRPLSAKGFKERFVFQAIICGGFLALLLFINMVDSGFTNAITGWVERNISYDMLAGRDGEGGLIDSIMGFFNNTDNETQSTDYLDAFMPQMGSQNSADFFRIDENILREINSAVDIYYENNRVP